MAGSPTACPTPVPQLAAGDAEADPHARQCTSPRVEEELHPDSRRRGSLAYHWQLVALLGGQQLGGPRLELEYGVARQPRTGTAETGPTTQAAVTTWWGPQNAREVGEFPGATARMQQKQILRWRLRAGDVPVWTWEDPF